MEKAKSLLLLGSLLIAAASAFAQTPPAMRIRGTVIAFDGHLLKVMTREGRDASLVVPADARVNVLSPLKLSDVRQGSFVGVTAVQRGPGTPLQAREVHVFPEAQRGTGEGHYAWDLEPGSSMTNANVDAVVDTNSGKELTLSYKGGSQKIIVPRDVPIITFAPADTSLLKAGAKVFAVAQRSADGSLTVQRISVGKDGLKPPM